MKRGTKNGSICGANCKRCSFSAQCKGCIKTGGHPFGGPCVIANCVRSRGHHSCSDCDRKNCEARKQLADEVNALEIEGMPLVESIFALAGFVINVEYPQEDGSTLKVLDDSKVYLGTQVKREDSERFIGVAADEDAIVVCEYDNGGGNAKLLAQVARTTDEDVAGEVEETEGAE